MYLVRGLGLVVAASSSLLAKTASAGTSNLWGNDGELWDPNNSMLYNYTDAGYMLGNEPIPDWPVDVSVLDFGAVPDDTVSDVAAFQSAIAACAPFHAILVPNGRYIIDGVIDVTANDIVIRGESRDGAVLSFPKHMSEIQGTATSDTRFIQFHGGSNRGIENLSLVFRNEQKATGWFNDPAATSQVAEHWWYSGEGPVDFNNGEENSWIRNVYIKNANHAINVGGFHSKQISVINIVLDQFVGRKGLNDGTDGHMGVKVSDGADNCLVHNILFTGTWAHEIAIMGTHHTVFSRIQGQNLELDHHASGNSFCLFTEVDTGAGARGYGGTTNNIEETYWGIKGLREDSYLLTSSKATMVGVNTNQATSIGATWHHETLDAETLVPANMYLAQLSKVPGKYVPPDTTLTLPLPASSDVLQLLPVDDAMVDSSSTKVDTNYGFGAKLSLKRNRREGFMKFDFSGTGLTSVVHAKLKVYMTTGNQNSPFGFQLLDVTDDSWSEGTLTWNNKPVAGALVFETYIDNTVDVPAWIEVDITTHVNNALGGDQIMSLKLQGDGALHQKDSQNTIRTKDGGNSAHLVLYQDASMVAPPAEPTGVTANGGLTEVSLDWNDNAESDFASYNIYRHDGLGNYKAQAMGLTTSDYTDYVVTAGNTYTYAVTAVDVAGTESIQSTSVVATLSTDQPSLSPSGAPTVVASSVPTGNPTETAPPTTTPGPIGSFAVIWENTYSDCEVLPNGCIVEHPGTYGGQEICTFKLSNYPAILQVNEFDVRDGDRLEIGSTYYTGTVGPQGVQIPVGQKLKWRSNGSSGSVGAGFEICPLGVPSFSIIFQNSYSDCEVLPNGCIVEHPGTYGTQELCTFQLNDHPAILQVNTFDVRDGDRLEIDTTYYTGTAGPQGVQIPVGQKLKWRTNGGSSSVGLGFEICPLPLGLN